jgi:hypothetical protein
VVAVRVDEPINKRVRAVPQREPRVAIEHPVQPDSAPTQRHFRCLK